ncbi:AttT protein [Haladaptatus sp. R4]|uniref:GNAT family N-acetyltransferase n=1 Tax=Haladaptatus sp. R4 TaxID=1679489 RepID=UPI0007B48CCA|nr:GNAT family N-acetyltransferase [Haladaptatus sp. R4]KZN25626.1 AttT protein [Haladaptatus sp. R4]
MSYEVRDELPTVDEFVALRDAAGMVARSRDAVEQGLPNTVFGVITVDETGETVGMARILGDGGMVYQIGDMAVHPDHQRRGLGSRMMKRLMEYLEENAPERAYVNLMADVEGFYEQFGFEYTAPASRGMYRRM